MNEVLLIEISSSLIFDDHIDVLKGFNDFDQSHPKIKIVDNK